MQDPVYVFNLATFDEVLKKVQAIEPTAYIGGGAIRDMLTNRPIKDIDIFVPASADLDKIGEVFADTHHLSHVTKSSDYFDFADPTVKEAREYTPNEDGKAVNIIAMTPDHFPVDVNVRRFDFGICRVAYRGGSDIVITPDFIHDLDNEVFTLRRCENGDQFDRSMNRYQRLRAKYDWPVVIPEEFNKYHYEQQNLDSGV